MENKWEASSSFFVCPLCGKQMNVSGSSMVCEGNHCYDISKKGYINFVQKNSIKIYNAELFQSRHLLYSTGFYDEIVETMDLLVGSYICGRGKCTIADAGCGEGTFLTRLCSQANGRKIGFDISKDAILQAAGRSEKILWLVADLANIPLKDKCVDVLFNIFTPANYRSFHRILKEDGILVKVIPGIEYLQEFKEAFPTGIKSLRDDGQVIRYLSQHMKIMETKKVHYKVCANKEQVRSWIKMTPMMAHIPIDEGTLSSIRQVTIDVNVCICRK